MQNKLRNGTYEVTQKGISTKYRMIVYYGTYKLYDWNRPTQFIRSINKQYLDQYYEVGEQIKGAKRLYNILWQVGINKREILSLNAPYAVVKAKIKELRSNTHRTGILIPIRAELC